MKEFIVFTFLMAILFAWTVYERSYITEQQSSCKNEDTLLVNEIEKSISHHLSGMTEKISAVQQLQVKDDDMERIITAVDNTLKQIIQERSNVFCTEDGKVRSTVEGDQQNGEKSSGDKTEPQKEKCSKYNGEKLTDVSGKGKETSFKDEISDTKSWVSWISFTSAIIYRIFFLQSCAFAVFWLIDTNDVELRLSYVIYILLSSFGSNPLWLFDFYINTRDEHGELYLYVYILMLMYKLIWLFGIAGLIYIFKNCKEDTQPLQTLLTIIFLFVAC